MMSSQRHAVGQRIIIEGLFLGPAEWLGNLKSEEGIMSLSFEFKVK